MVREEAKLAKGATYWFLGLLSKSIVEFNGLTSGSVGYKTWSFLVILQISPFKQ